MIVPQHYRTSLLLVIHVCEANAIGIYSINTDSVTSVSKVDKVLCKTQGPESGLWISVLKNALCNNHQGNKPRMISLPRERCDHESNELFVFS